MITSLNRHSFLNIMGVFSLVAFVGCAEFNDPYGSDYGYGSRDPYYSGGYRDDDYYRDRNRHDRRDIERERRRVEEDRRRLEEERNREAGRHRPPPPPPRQNDRCPSGFSPSENKCSPQERRRGCRDIRLPSGLGCVSR